MGFWKYRALVIARSSPCVGWMGSRERTGTVLFPHVTWGRQCVEKVERIVLQTGGFRVALTANGNRFIYLSTDLSCTAARIPCLCPVL